jgi:hypothetical protein
VLAREAALAWRLGLGRIQPTAPLLWDPWVYQYYDNCGGLPGC